jgi:hypothetical protein
MSLKITRFSYSALIAGAVMLAASALPASAQIIPIRDWQYPDPKTGQFPCFGYIGTFKKDSKVIRVEWYGNGVLDECFGIAPDKSIWHTWPHAGGWHRFASGRADDMFDAFEGRDRSNPTAEVRSIQVCVIGSGLWQNNNERGHWYGWYLFGGPRDCQHYEPADIPEEIGEDQLWDRSFDGQQSGGELP